VGLTVEVSLVITELWWDVRVRRRFHRRRERPRWHSVYAKGWGGGLLMDAVSVINSIDMMTDFACNH
jgi:hypothetical protein